MNTEMETMRPMRATMPARSITQRFRATVGTRSRASFTALACHFISLAGDGPPDVSPPVLAFPRFSSIILICHCAYSISCRFGNPGSQGPKAAFRMFLTLPELGSGPGVPPLALALITITPHYHEDSGPEVMAPRKAFPQPLRIEVAAS